MKTVDQVSRGAANFFDEGVRPSLPGWKAIAYGVAVGRIASNAPKLLERYEGELTMLGILKDGMIDVEGLAADLKEQMQRSGGDLSITLMGDTFTFKPADVDSLVYCIERA